MTGFVRAGFWMAAALSALAIFMQNVLSDDQKPQTAPTSRHAEIQYHLLKLAAEVWPDVWIARTGLQQDRSTERLAK